MMDFLLYFLSLAALTLGTLTVCGLAVRLCSHLFSSLLGRGSGAVFDVTSVIGTPIHELGHAFMCLLFFHPIERIKLWTPNPKNGVYGFVEHRYNRKNLWARLGNLPIAFGPIFSGLAVTVLMLYLCFPTLWNDYLVSSQALIPQGAPAADRGEAGGEALGQHKELGLTLALGGAKPRVGAIEVFLDTVRIRHGDGRELNSGGGEALHGVDSSRACQTDRNA